MQEFSQVFQDLLWRFFWSFLLHLFSDLLHRFGCMTVSHGSPIFGVCFCDTGVGVAHSREKNSLYLNSPRTQRKELNCFQEKFIKKKETKTYSKKPTLTQTPHPSNPKINPENKT